MAATKYSYSISTNITAASFNSDLMMTDIADSSIVTALQHIARSADTIDIWFVDALSGADQTTLNSVVQNHAGVASTRTVFIESTIVVGPALSISSDQTFEDLGVLTTDAQGVLVTSGQLGDMSRAVGRCVCGMKTNGTGVELKIVEIDDSGNETDLMSAAYSVPNTSDAWKIQKFTTNVQPSSGDRTFVLRGRLNGATSASIRGASITLLDVGT